MERKASEGTAGIEGTNISYQARIIDPPVIPDVLGEFLSKLLATDAVGFSSNVAFRRYHVWPKSILGKGRYRRNKTRPYHYPGYSLLHYCIPILNLVLLFPEPLKTFKLPA